MIELVVTFQKYEQEQHKLIFKFIDGRLKWDGQNLKSRRKIEWCPLDMMVPRLQKMLMTGRPNKDWTYDKKDKDKLKKIQQMLVTEGI